MTAAVAEHIARRGIPADVVTMGFRDLPSFEQEGTIRIFRVPCLRSRRHICYLHELLTYVISAFLTARRLIRTESYQLIHAHFIFPSGIVAYLLHWAFNIPYVITAHGSDVPGYNPDRFRTAHALLAPAWRSVLAKAAAVTSPSRSLARLILRSSRRPRKIEIIPNGIAPDWNAPRVKQRRILLVSRLFERKGVQYLLQALGQSGLGYEVHIVGDGPYRPTLELMARGLRDRVVFHGWVDQGSEDLKELYRTASIFVLPSIAENFPICLLEAMVSGAAIVATDLDACREVLGNAAVFVPPGDPTAIRAKLVALINNRRARDRLADRARRRVLDQFTWDRLGQQYLKLFRTVVQSRADRLPKGKALPVLICPGDIRYNAGDMAICLGVVQQVRAVLPNSEITVWGRLPCYPAGFEGLRFEPSLSLGLLSALARAHAVLWGGGQLLQSNRSRVKIPFWIARIAMMRLFGKRIMGFAQGVGPLEHLVDRKLARLAVRWTQSFTVRDRESLRILQMAGARTDKICVTGDPGLAFAPHPNGHRPGTTALPKAGGGTVGLSLRYTGHHRSDRIVPFRYLPPPLRRRVFESPHFQGYLTMMTALCDRLVRELDVRITLFPMYYAPWETDELIAQMLVDRVSCRNRVDIHHPTLGTAELFDVVRTFDAVVATPMHATVFATSQYVPTLALYYEPKGREFFELIRQERWVFPLEALWSADGSDRLQAQVLALWDHRDIIRTELSRQIPPMKRRAAYNTTHLRRFLAGAEDNA